MRTRCVRVETRNISMREQAAFQTARWRKRAEVEVAAELAVDAQQHVQVERGADAERIVVGEQQIALGLDEIRADAGTRRRAQASARMRSSSAADAGGSKLPMFEPRNSTSVRRRIVARRVACDAMIASSPSSNDAWCVTTSTGAARRTACAPRARARRRRRRPDARSAARDGALDQRLQLAAVARSELDEARQPGQTARRSPRDGARAAASRRA